MIRLVDQDLFQVISFCLGVVADLAQPEICVNNLFCRRAKPERPLQVEASLFFFVGFGCGDPANEEIS
ncbi:MAG: hypothetical protein P8Z74_19410, partial [Acidobacteriota bacterium]